MPTYDANVVYLSQAIESCLEQTYSKLELIIVDDGSTNETPEIIKSYTERDDRIRTIRHEINKKLPGALNTGFKSAQGDYVTWLSDDDLFRTMALEKMVGFLEDHSEFDLVYTDYSLIDELGKSIGAISVGRPEEIGIHKPTGICHLARHKVIEALHGYNEEFFLAEDFDFWVRALIKFNMAPLHLDLALYRQHNKTLTNTFAKRRILHVQGKILDRYIRDMWWLNRQSKTHAYLRLSKHLFLARDFHASIHNFLKSLRYNPSILPNLLLRKIRQAIQRQHNYNYPL